jgi:hypothetical protein
MACGRLHAEGDLRDKGRFDAILHAARRAPGVPFLPQCARARSWWRSLQVAIPMRKLAPEHQEKNWRDEDPDLRTGLDGDLPESST